MAATARVAEGPRVPLTVPITHYSATERVVLVFIDSLRREVATNRDVMPNLVRLTEEGASFDVEPCRDQLTYLCLRAALTGRDDSSLLSISDNFRPDHEAPPNTLLTALAARRRISVIGSSDFHPYRPYLFAEHPLPKSEETEENVLGLLNVARADDSALVIVSLASGDMNAHAHGVASNEYATAFGRMDRIVGAIARNIDPGTQLVVFGDHGHDALGRHLPGTASRTFALYRGPAFRSKVASSLDMTDHQALLGVLLGVPVHATFRGPDLSRILEPGWVNRMLGGRLPSVHAPKVSARDDSIWRWGVAAGIAFAGWVLLCGSIHWTRAFGERARLTVLTLRMARNVDNSRISVGWVNWTVLALMLTAAGIGTGYDPIRGLLHDHGDSPWRALALLMLPCVGGVATWTLVRHHPLRARSVRWPWLWATCTLLLTFLIMLPTAYYYGTRRAVLLAAVLAITTWLLEYYRDSVPRRFRDFGNLVALTFVAAVLVSFYSVRQLGPETGAAATWALDARIYTQHPRIALALAKLFIYFVLVVPHARRRPLDTAVATALFSTSCWVETAGMHLPKEFHLCLFLALVVATLVARRQAPSSLLAGGLLLLDHLYEQQATQLAGIEMLIAATAMALAVFCNAGRSKTERAWLTAVTVVLAGYLMFWPAVGFHLTGIDFSFMFQWVEPTQYEAKWQWIAAGLVLKIALPMLLLTGLASTAIHRNGADRLIVVLLLAKVALLSTLIAFYAARHSMASQQAIAMLAELILLLFGALCIVASPPTTLVRQSSSGRLKSSNQVHRYRMIRAKTAAP